MGINIKSDLKYVVRDVTYCQYIIGVQHDNIFSFINVSISSAVATRYNIGDMIIFMKREIIII